MTVFIPGAPYKTAQQKGVRRLKSGGVMFYTKDEVKAEGLRMRGYLKSAKPKRPLEGPLRVCVSIVHPLTMQLAKQYADRLEDVTLLIPHPKRPDADNTAKLVLDMAGQAGWWIDDAQIADLRIQKFYGAVPGITVGCVPYVLEIPRTRYPRARRGMLALQKLYRDIENEIRGLTEEQATEFIRTGSL